MPTMSFENLEVYKLSEALADDIWGIVVKWAERRWETNR